jgi:hypothetical protein
MRINFDPKQLFHDLHFLLPPSKTLTPPSKSSNSNRNPLNYSSKSELPINHSKFSDKKHTQKFGSFHGWGGEHSKNKQNSNDVGIKGGRKRNLDEKLLRLESN